MSCPNNELINLETQQENHCKENCSFNFSYNPNSSCVLTNKGDYLEIKTDGKNKVTYNNQKIVLNDVRLYIPSLHTFDGKNTDAELLLKHAGANGQNIIVSVPIIAKDGHSNSATFFSKLAPFIPSAKNEPVNVNVSNWSLDDVFPAAKTPFYNYTGDSPYPPCNMQATVIIFDKDHAVTIKPSDLDLFKKQIKSSVPKDLNIEGFIGGKLREGLITYNSAGANTGKDATIEAAEALECTEYDDTSGEDESSKTPGKTSNIAIDWSKLAESPFFIFGIIILICFIGWLFIKYGFPKIIGDIDSSAKTAPITVEIPNV